MLDTYHINGLDCLVLDSLSNLVTECPFLPLKLVSHNSVLVHIEPGIEERWVLIDQLEIRTQLLKFAEGGTVSIELEGVREARVRVSNDPSEHELLV